MRINAISFFCCSVLGCSLLMTSVQASGQFLGNDSAAVDKRVTQLMHGFSGYAVRTRRIWWLRVTGMVSTEIQSVHRKPIAQGFPRTYL
jgi:hypothetical protein